MYIPNSRTVGSSSNDPRSGSQDPIVRPPDSPYSELEDSGSMAGLLVLGIPAAIRPRSIKPQHSANGRSHDVINCVRLVSTRLLRPATHFGQLDLQHAKHGKEDEDAARGCAHYHITRSRARTASHKRRVLTPAHPAHPHWRVSRSHARAGAIVPGLGSAARMCEETRNGCHSGQARQVEYTVCQRQS